MSAAMIQQLCHCQRVAAAEREKEEFILGTTMGFRFSLSCFSLAAETVKWLQKKEYCTTIPSGAAGLGIVKCIASSFY
jgi:hypothetical protein